MLPVWAQRHYPTKWALTRTLGVWVEKIIMPQFDWLCDVCGCVMSLILGIYKVDLGFINNYKESQLWLVFLKYSADMASAFFLGRYTHSLARLSKHGWLKKWCAMLFKIGKQLINQKDKFKAKGLNPCSCWRFLANKTNPLELFTEMLELHCCLNLLPDMVVTHL